MTYDLKHCAFCGQSIRWEGGLAVHAMTGSYWAASPERHHVVIDHIESRQPSLFGGEA